MNDKRNCKTPLRSVLLKAGSFEVYFHSKSSFTEVQAMRIIVTSKSLRFPLKIMFHRRRKHFHREIQKMRERMCEEPCVFLVHRLVWLDGISRYTCIIITRWMLIILHYILIIYNIYYISTLYIIYFIQYILYIVYIIIMMTRWIQDSLVGGKHCNRCSAITIAFEIIAMFF